MLKACFSSPKLRALQSLLGCGLAATVGHLELLWLFAGNHAPHGNVGKWSDLEIAAACEWTGDAALFVEALCATRWLDEHSDGRLIIHDWEEHAPRWVKAVVAKTKKPFFSPTVVDTTEDTVEPTLFYSSPISSSHNQEDTHTPARREKELRLPKEADTERNREQLEKWQGERERRHGDRTSIIAWEASAMTWTGWTEQHWFDSLLLSTRVGSRDLCNADKDHQKRAGPSKEKKPSSSAVLSSEELDRYKTP